MAETATVSDRIRIPRAAENDYTHEMAAERREFVSQRTGADLSHVAMYSFDPSTLPGNIENFVGVAQVPIGLAGPLVIHGEHARGEFYVPHHRGNSGGQLQPGNATSRCLWRRKDHGGRGVHAARSGFHSERCPRSA